MREITCSESSDTICLTCSECGDLIEVFYQTAVEIWEWEEQAGEKVTCSACPDAYQKSQLKENE